jgi:hypothetical protein
MVEKELFASINRNEVGGNALMDEGVEKLFSYPLYWPIFL